MGVGLLIVILDSVFKNVIISFAAILLGFVAMAVILNKFKKII